MTDPIAKAREALTRLRERYVDLASESGRASSDRHEARREASAIIEDVDEALTALAEQPHPATGPAMCRACGNVYSEDCGHRKNARDMNERIPCQPVTLALWEREQSRSAAERSTFSKDCCWPGNCHGGEGCQHDRYVEQSRPAEPEGLEVTEAEWNDIINFGAEPAHVNSFVARAKRDRDRLLSRPAAAEAVEQLVSSEDTRIIAEKIARKYAAEGEFMTCADAIEAALLARLPPTIGDDATAADIASRFPCLNTGEQAQLILLINRLLRSRSGVPASEWQKAEGWAVVSDKGIAVRTISDTRRAAIVNWLVTARSMMVASFDTDETIEAWWQQMRGDTRVVQVTIRAPAPPAGKGE